MRIIFVRHGKPDYKTDTLLELGKRQAAAVAERLKDEGISEIYASTMGRAMETAAPSAEALGLTVKPIDFIREIGWGNLDGEELEFGGHPWIVSENMVKRGESVFEPDFLNSESFLKNDKLALAVRRVIDGGDRWLASLGFLRERDYYRATCDDTDKTVAIFSHHGSSVTFMAHMLNITSVSVYRTFNLYFASVSIIELNAKKGELCTPVIKLLGDCRHVPRDEDPAILKI